MIKFFITFILTNLLLFVSSSQKDTLKNSENVVQFSTSFGASRFLELNLNQTLEENNVSQINEFGIKFALGLDFYIKNLWVNYEAAVTNFSSDESFFNIINNRVGVGFFSGGETINFSINGNYSLNLNSLRYHQIQEDIIINSNDLNAANDNVLRFTSPLTHSIGLSTDVRYSFGGGFDMSMRFGYDWAINSFNWRSNATLSGFDSERVSLFYFQIVIPVVKFKI